MRSWTPPKGTTVHVAVRPSRDAPPREKPKRRGLMGSLASRLAPSPSPALPDRPAALDLIKQLGQRHAMERLGVEGATLNIDDPRLSPLIDALESAASQGVEMCACHVIEQAPNPSADAWYAMRPCQRRFFRPSDMRPSQHFATFHGSRLLASETLVQVVQETGLMGLDWLPLPDVPDRDPLTWYQVFGTHFLGRGLDHPMFDRAHYNARHDGDPLTSPARCIGESLVFSQYVRADVRIADSRLERLRHMASPAAFRVDGRPRLVREFLPPTDFAYRGPSYGVETMQPAFGRMRSLYCSHRAREALISARVMRPSDFEPVRVIPARDADVEVLDRRPFPVPPPTFTPEEAIAELARREAIKRSSSAPHQSLRFASWQEVRQYLETRLREGSATWAPMSSEGAAKALADRAARSCPKAWRMLLPLIPESVDDPTSDGLQFECGTPYEDTHHEEGVTRDESGPLAGDIVIAWSPNGDWFAIRPSDPSMPEEARVTWWDHETLQARHEWPSICAFVAALIEAADRAVAS